MEPFEEEPISPTEDELYASLTKALSKDIVPVSFTPSIASMGNLESHI